MSAASVLLQVAVLAGAAIGTKEIEYFPGRYFDAEVHDRLREQVMTTWPGPSGLVELWRSDGLDEEQRVALLIGGGTFHDPLLLPIYREAVVGPSQRLRMAAAYGYRELLADRLPLVAGGVDDETAARLADEMRGVEWTLRQQPMVAMWLQSALANEQLVFPGFKGLAPRRAASDCFAAIDRILVPDDLELLIRAYRISQDKASRLALLRLIESMTLSRFIDKPRGPRAAWGTEIYDRAMDALDARISSWVDRRCEVDYRRIVSSNLDRIGARGVDPLHPDACVIWQLILLQDAPGWWAEAARRLYDCNGPWIELSALRSETPANDRARDRLIGWYRVRELQRSLKQRPSAD